MAAAGFPVYKYIISRTADPIFAVFIGLGAAATRIDKEEKAKGRTTEETITTAKRRIGFTLGLQDNDNESSSPTK